VQTPVHLNEAKLNMVEYAESGLPGCVGSSDCMHILMEGCEYILKKTHLGGKSSNTTCTFNLTCNHQRPILHMTKGGLGHWNNQTMVCLDNFISGIRDGLILSNNKFNLMSYDSNKNIVQMTYTGVYVIVDNGYLLWSCTVPPYSTTNKINKTWWLKWIELMRKDVECTFGILKGRWRILKSGVENVDKVWFTCCAFHNWPLEIDSLNGQWRGRVPLSNWEGEMGSLDFDGLSSSIPNAISRLSTNLDPRNYNQSGMGPGEDVVGECNDNDRGLDDGIVGFETAVKDLSLPFFRC
jgi:hypothetical protein